MGSSLADKGALENLFVIVVLGNSCKKLKEFLSVVKFQQGLTVLITLLNTFATIS